MATLDYKAIDETRDFVETFSLSHKKIIYTGYSLNDLNKYYFSTEITFTAFIERFTQLLMDDVPVYCMAIYTSKQCTRIKKSLVTDYLKLSRMVGGGVE